MLDLSQYLLEVSPESKCGENLEYDPRFQSMEQEAEGTPERQVGDSIIPAEAPDWKSVKKSALDLLERTKDIKVVVCLTRALSSTNEFAGVEQGFSLIRGLLEKYWEDVYPQQETDDDYPVIRINSLSTLNDYDAFLNLLQNIPLSDSRSMGRFDLRDIKITKGEINVTDASAETPERSVIDASFMDTQLSELESKLSAVENSIEHIGAISAVTIDKVGSVNAPDFSDLLKMFREISAILSEQIQNQGGEVSSLQPEFASGNNSDHSVSDGQAVGINSREDVARRIDEICRYFQRSEPTSPVPFLLKRAKKLLHLDFMGILQEIAPDAMDQAENICGSDRQIEYDDED